LTARGGQTRSAAASRAARSLVANAIAGWALVLADERQLSALVNALEHGLSNDPADDQLDLARCLADRPDPSRPADREDRLGPGARSRRLIPVPDSATVAGLAGSLLEICSVAVRTPSTYGANRTVNSHCWPELIIPRQPSEPVRKSPASAPVNVSPLIDRAFGP
jgi:hypothetical protein